MFGIRTGMELSVLKSLRDLSSGINNLVVFYSKNIFLSKKRSISASLFCPGSSLFSQAVASQVFSAPESLTTVFGMGTGVASPSLPPGMFTAFNGYF